MHDKHNLATPSPVTDGALVFAWFGTGQIVALDRTGAVVWQRHLAKENGAFDIQWGHGSSPVLYGDLLILLVRPAGSLVPPCHRQEDRQGSVEGRPRAGALVLQHAARGRRRRSAPRSIVNSTERIDAYDAKTGSVPLAHRRRESLCGAVAGRFTTA